MKKGLMAYVIVSFVLSIILSSNLYAQENKGADPTKRAQTDITADSDNYFIGPEDVLHIYVWREESLTKTVPVRMDGKISLPLVDDIQAAGLTPLQLKDVLTQKLKGFVDNPTISVTVLEANSFKVYVSGEVRQPGVQRIRSEITLVKLITMVGGFTEWANKKKILILRNELGVDKRITVNYTKIIEGKEPDIIINRGDTVIVP
jgi:polysaccharide biosynthesis/export protein